MSDADAVHRDDEHDELDPLFYPSRKLTFRAPFRWLRLGWLDLKRAPGPSLVYGFGIVLFFDLIVWLVWDGENTMALFSLGMAFILAAPVLAFGLYSVSRQLEHGHEPRLGVCWRESKNHLRNEMLFALVMLVVLLVWARAATMVNVFLPISDDMSWLDWVQYFGVGSVVGSIFATIVFCASVVSLPMMLDRDTDAVTSALTSVGAVFKNKGVMLLWAGLILSLLLFGFATALLGLAVTLPLIGHATWHAYRETVLPLEVAIDD